MEALDASRFGAEEGLRDGRQKAAEANGRHVAGTGRVEYVGTPGLVLGASVWSGDTGFAFPRLDSSVTLVEADGRYRTDELTLRGLYAHAYLDGIRVSGAVGCEMLAASDVSAWVNILTQARDIVQSPSRRRCLFHRTVSSY